MEYVNQGWTLSWDKTNQMYKLQKRINGKVVSYTLPRKFNEFCKRLKEESKCIFQFSRKRYLIKEIMRRHNLDEPKIYDVLKKYVEWKLSKKDGLKDLLYKVICMLVDIEDLKDELNKASRMVRTGFGFAGLTFQCPNCFENSKLKYDESIRKWVCSKCGKIPF